MSFQKVAFMSLGVLLLLSNFQLKPSECVRLCGRQLADLLNTICERRGGFHTPRENAEESSGSTRKRAVIEIFRPLTRRTDPEETNAEEESTGINGDISFNFQSGVVDECCRKPCSFSALVSYCADAPQSGTIDLDGILSSGNGDQTLTSDELSAFEMQQISSAVGSSGSNSNQLAHSSNADSQRPNLGLSNRSRPVFIVLSQATDDEDRSTGEYRF